MPTTTQPPIADGAEPVEVVVRFIDNFSDVIDRMQSHSCGYLDRALLTELRATIEDQAWSALVAYQTCCWFEGDPDAVVATVKARRVATT